MWKLELTNMLFRVSYTQSKGLYQHLACQGREDCSFNKKISLVKLPSKKIQTNKQQTPQNPTKPGQKSWPVFQLGGWGEGKAGKRGRKSRKNLSLYLLFS